MAYFFGDGFNLYTAWTDALGHWDYDSVSLNSSLIMAGRYGGQAVYVSSSSVWRKTSGINDSIHHINLAFQQNQTLSGTLLGYAFTLYDGTIAQCSIVFRVDGTILLVSGIPTSGTILATWAGGVPTQGAWQSYEFEIVIHNTTGSFTARRNGNSINDFQATGLDTQVSANAYANKIQMTQAQVGAVSHYIDDFLWRSDASSISWTGELRCFTRRPDADAAIQLQRTTNTIGSQETTGSTGIYNNFVEAFYVLFTASYTGIIVSGSVKYGTGGTGNARMAIFTSVGGAVGTVVATSNQVTNPSGITQFVYPTSGRLIAGTQYWLGIHESVSMNYDVLNTTNIIKSSTVPYASWPIPNPGGTPGTYNTPGRMTIVYAPGSNADCVAEITQDGLTTYVYSSVTGESDLYTLQSTGLNRTSVLGVVTRAYAQKSDAGSRGMALQLKSGATIVQSATMYLPLTQWQWLSRTDLVDPNTGAAWTGTAIDNIQFGPILTL